MVFVVYEENELNAVAQYLLDRLETDDCVLLYGDLGSGKTTFVKHLIQQMALDEEVSSPTFSLVNIYEGGEDKIYHIDLYRLESEDELINAGIEEVISGPGLKLIEWPELAEPFTEGLQVHRLRFVHLEGGGRKVLFL